MDRVVLPRVNAFLIHLLRRFSTSPLFRLQLGCLSKPLATGGV
jgi:hypothetical protein